MVYDFNKFKQFYGNLNKKSFSLINQNYFGLTTI